MERNCRLFVGGGLSKLRFLGMQRKWEFNYCESSIFVSDSALVDLEKLLVFNAFRFESSPTCNSNCQCDYVKYSPVCGSDGNSYISACHAGCKVGERIGNKMVFQGYVSNWILNLTFHNFLVLRRMFLYIKITIDWKACGISKIWSCK